MSLITDTLKKMKKENDSNVEQDDEILAPPALRNAIVNTKKYKEFVKNSELRDKNGNKAPLKGFVLFSVLLIAVIGVTAAVFLNKEEKEMVNKAGIVSQADAGSAAQSNINKQAGAVASKKPESLGRPYGSEEQTVKNEPVVNQVQTVVSNNIQANTQTNTQAATQNNITVSSQQESSKVLSALPMQQNNIPQNIQESAAVKRKEVKQENKADIQNKESGAAAASNIILPNQLFVIPPMQDNKAVSEPKEQAVDKAGTAEIQESSVRVKESIPAASVGNNTNNINNNVEDNKADTNTAAANINRGTKIYAGVVAGSNIPVSNNSVEVNTPVSIQKDSGTSISSINEVKTLKSNDKPGSVTASTISLYNQYISTGNKAKNEGAYDRAIEYYVNAFALNKSDELSANIALMYIKLKNPNMAFQVSVTNGMKDTKLLSQLAVLMIQQKYYLEANKLIQYANTFQRSSDVLLATGYLNQSQNKLDDALKYYNEALTVDGSNINAAYYAGMCYELQGKNDEAKKMYEKVLSSPKADSKLKAQVQKKLSSL